jgi:NADH:ubiquinone oxidoreductase subunit B-like Fe-S oxidoreductase
MFCKCVFDDIPFAEVYKIIYEAKVEGRFSFDDGSCEDAGGIYSWVETKSD